LASWAAQIAKPRAGRANCALTDASAPAPRPTAPIPTLSEWAMILFGLLWVGGTTVTIQRRRLA